MPNPAWTGLQDQYAKIFNAFPPSWNAALKKSIQNKSEKEFHALAESMPQIVWITNAEGLNIYFNQPIQVRPWKKAMVMVGSDRFIRMTRN
jgi:hypothetical protein